MSRRVSDAPILLPVAATADLEATYGAQEVDFAKGRPWDVGKVELAIHALPEHETAEAYFSARTHDEVWLRNVWSV
jgi:hypothetical protein